MTTVDRKDDMGTGTLRLIVEDGGAVALIREHGAAQAAVIAATDGHPMGAGLERYRKALAGAFDAVEASFIAVDLHTSRHDGSQAPNGASVPLRATLGGDDAARAVQAAGLAWGWS